MSRGGARKGAGRPALAGRTETIAFRLPSKTVQAYKRLRKRGIDIRPKVAELIESEPVPDRDAEAGVG